jgi:hypothetical protein
MNSRRRIHHPLKLHCGKRADAQNAGADRTDEMIEVVPPTASGCQFRSGEFGTSPFFGSSQSRQSA